MSRKGNRRLVAASTTLILTLCLSLAGCTTKEEGDTLAALQSGLSTLVANRTLAEQFVRDVKASEDPSDPAYQQVMESYDNARDSYNRFLDNVEAGATRGKAPQDVMQRKFDAQDSTAEFLEDATRALKPSMSTRGIDFRRAVRIPQNLGNKLHKLPGHERGALIDQFDNQVRWRSWSEI